MTKRNLRSTIAISFLVLLQLTVGSLTASARQEKFDNSNTEGDQYSDPKLRPEILPSPSIKLPDKPEDIESKNTEGATTVLQGTAEATEVSAKAELMTGNPLSRYRGDKLVFYKIYIKNGGATPVLILGRDAQIASVKTLKAATLEAHDNTLLTPKEKALVAAVGVGSAGLASSLFYEAMTPSEHRHRNRGIALGRDRGRHEVEAENLGTRLMMPGDETCGWIAFEDNDSIKSQNAVGVPVMFPPYSTVGATLKIPVTGTTSAAFESPPDKPAESYKP